MRELIGHKLKIESAELAKLLKAHLGEYRTSDRNGVLWFENEYGEGSGDDYDEDKGFGEDYYYFDVKVDENGLVMNMNNIERMLKAEGMLDAWFVGLLLGTPDMADFICDDDGNEEDGDKHSPEVMEKLRTLREQSKALIGKQGTLKMHYYAADTHMYLESWYDTAELLSFGDTFNDMIDDPYTQENYTSAKVRSADFAAAVGKYCREKAEDKGGYYTFKPYSELYAVRIEGDTVYSTAASYCRDVWEYFSFLGKDSVMLLNDAEYTETILRSWESSYDDEEEEEEFY